MKVIADDPPEQPVVALRRTRRVGGRRRIRFVLVVGATVLLAVGLVGIWNRDLIGAYLTHRVGEPSQTWDVIELPLGAQPELRVALVGDVGDGGSREHETAAGIKTQSDRDRYDILMLLGDNVYPAGDPDRVRATVYEPFGPLLDSGTELLAALGNHDDIEGAGDAELEAMGIPGRWYSVQRGDGLSSSWTRPTPPTPSSSPG